MTRRGGSWRASLRIARRDAWKHKSRTALVVALIAVPVAVMAYADVTFRTMQGTPAAQVTSRIGTAADAWISTPGPNRLIQSPPSNPGSYTGSALTTPPATLRELVPNLKAALPITWGGSDGTVVATTPIASQPVATVELDYQNHLAAGFFTQLSGRAPRSTGEIAISSTLASALSVHVGSHLKVAGRPYVVVGIVRPFFHRDEVVVGKHGAFAQVPSDANYTPNVAPFASGWLISTTTPVTYADELRMNALGVTVDSRFVAEHSPSPCSPEVPAKVRFCYTSSLVTAHRAQVLAMVGLIVGMVLLQVVLIVGPAFAIGRRRQTHDLALVSAVGGNRRDVRRVVLANGVVIGLVGGVVGLVAGIVIFFLTLAWVANFAGRDITSVALEPELLVLVAVAVMTGLCAAWLPAHTAAKQDVVRALAGRRSIAPASGRYVVFGLLAVVAGIAIAAFGTRPHASQAMLLGCVIAEIGLVALTPAIVTAVSRLAAHTPTLPRFALRDAGRNRGRAGTAAAAVLAAVAAASAIGVYTSSEKADAARHYTSSVPLGQVYLQRNLQASLTSIPNVTPVAKVLPTKSVVPLSGLAPELNPTDRCDTAICAGGWDATLPAGVSRVCTQGMNFATWPCLSGYNASWSPLLVGNAATYRAVTGNALAAPFARELSNDRALISGDLVHYIDRRGFITFARTSGHGTIKLPSIAVTGQSSEAASRFTAIIPPALAAQLGMKVVPLGVMIETKRMPSTSELAKAASAAGLVTPPLVVAAGTPYDGPSDAPLLIILLAAVVLAILATGVATALANADARPDLATMAAVGAAPRSHRIIASCSAAVVAMVGTALGATAGLIVGMVATHASPDSYGSAGYSNGADNGPRLPISIPWGHLFSLWVAIPVIAVVVAFIFTRSRLPMVRRLT